METIVEVKKALKLVKNNKFEDAEKIYLNLLKEAPNNSNILSFLGLLYIEKKDFFKAEEIFEKAYSLDKNEIIISNLAILKNHFSKNEQAYFLYKELLQISSKVEYYINIIDLLINMVLFLDRQKYITDLYFYSKKALKLYPLDKHIILNYSIASMYYGNFKDSENFCNLALKIDSKFAKAWSQLGMLNEFLYLDELKAQDCYKLAMKYGNKNAYYDIGISYLKTNNYKAAIKYFHKSLKYIKNKYPVYVGIARCYFKQRKFKLGYRYYIKQNDPKEADKLKNVWNGKSYKNDTLLIFSDLCYGDQIMYIRYLPFLVNKFKKIKVLIYYPLFEIFKENYKKYKNIEFIKMEIGKPFPKYDYSAVLSKIPYYLGKDFHHIPYSNGYLNKIISSEKKIKNIGICWEVGNIDPRSSIHRNINITEFKPILELKNYNFYSLQVAPSNNEYKKFSKLINIGKDFKTFNDTSLAIKDMDLIISVDTSVANLAGAMNKKTFLLLPYYADWRWFDNNQKTEWYNSVRIFKQCKKYSWENEILKIKDFLEKNN